MKTFFIGSWVSKKWKSKLTLRLCEGIWCLDSCNFDSRSIVNVSFLLVKIVSDDERVSFYNKCDSISYVYFKSVLENLKKMSQY